MLEPCRRQKAEKKARTPPGQRQHRVPAQQSTKDAVPYNKFKQTKRSGLCPTPKYPGNEISRETNRSRLEILEMFQVYTFQYITGFMALLKSLLCQIPHIRLNHMYTV